MSLNGIKGVIFDLGSTLIEFETRDWDDIFYDGHKAGYYYLIKAGHNLPSFEVVHNDLVEIRNQFRSHSQKTLTEWTITQAPAKLFRQLGLDQPEILANQFMDRFYEVVQASIVMCDGAVEMLQSLKANGYRTGLISNTIFPPRHHEEDVVQYNLAPYLDFRIYSSAFGFRKPHESIYKEGLKQIDLSASEVIYVGDRFIEDVEGPQAIGIKGILKFREGRVYPDPLPDGTTVIHHLSEILDLLNIK